MAHTFKTIHPFFSEKNILLPVILLCGIGIVMVYSASSAISMQNHNTAFYFMKRQALFFCISLGVMFVTASFPYKLYKSISYLILFIAIALLIAVLIPGFKIKGGGAYRWLSLFGFTFQPAEFAKLALILFLGYSLSKKQELIEKFSVGFFPHFSIFMIFACLILFQPDFGTIVIIGLIVWGMMFIAGVKISHLLSPIPLFIPLAYFLITHEKYRMDRITGFLRPWQDQFDTGFQITHSLKAIGSGGLFGKGIALSMQKMHYLPEPHTDFIFAIIGEELGLIGVLAILSLYLILILKGINITKTSTDMFAAITAAGLTIYLGIQVIINTGVVLGLLPTKGLTLPFISYGGTSLVINMAAMGILMNIGASQEDEKYV